MSDETTGAATTGGPSGYELTEAEKLAALELYLKALKPYGDNLRPAITDDLEKRRVEKIGAYLPDGTKIATVSYRQGALTARVTDEAAALAWVMRKHPEHIMQAIRPAYLAMLLETAKKDAVVGGNGYDPSDGEGLPWIVVERGRPGVTVTGTAEGKARMAQIAGGFSRMIEAAK